MLGVCLPSSLCQRKIDDDDDDDVDDDDGDDDSSQFASKFCCLLTWAFLVELEVQLNLCKFENVEGKKKLPNASDFFIIIIIII